MCLLMRTDDAYKKFVILHRCQQQDTNICAVQLQTRKWLCYMKCKQCFFRQPVINLMWNKKPTRCHLELYLFLLYKLLNMFRANLCPSSGADDLVVFLWRVVYCCGCVGSQIQLAGCVSIGEYVAQLPNGHTTSQPDLTAYTDMALHHTRQKYH